MRPPVYRTAQKGYHRSARPLTTEDLRVMEMPDRYWDAATAEIPEDTRSREVAENFAARCDEIVRSGEPSLILIHGKAGTGKTSLASILAKIGRAHRFTAYWLDGPSILRKFPTNQITADGELTARERAYESELLIIDALGQGYVTNDYVAAETASLIKYRHDHRMLTVATTSMGKDQLADMFGTPFVKLMDESTTAVKCVAEYRVHSSAGGDE